MPKRLHKDKGIWWTATWNPITGCSPVSRGCDNCWAERFAHRFYVQQYGPDYFIPRFYRERLDQPSHWKNSKWIAVCLMGDFFHPAAKLAWQAAVLNSISKSPQHTYFFLTKRVDEMALFQHLCGGLDKENFWLGVSVEDQPTANKRLSELMRIPAAHWFVSVEPILALVDISPYLPHIACDGCGRRMMYVGQVHEILHDPSDRFPELCGKGQETVGLDWVILGAETGPRARPMDLNWARSMRDQCKSAGVPFWMKSAGCRKKIPKDLLVREWPEKFDKGSQ